VTISARLAEIDIVLPAVVKPLAAYVPAARTGNLVYTSGQLPMQAGEMTHTGKVGAEVSPEEGKIAARTCALNALAAIDALVGGSGRQGGGLRRLGTRFQRSARRGQRSFGVSG